MRTAVLLLLVVSACVGCAVGPDYQRPVVDAPKAYRGLLTEESAKTDSESLGDRKWWEVFEDKELQDLIYTALEQNYDVRIAAARVLEARAQLGVTRSNQYPSVNAGAGLSDQRTPQSPLVPAFQETAGELSLSASWALDFWGKYRRATEAARANLLASEWGRRAVATTLVANLARAYFKLRALDSELEIAQRALATRQDSLRLTTLLADHGSTSLLDVRQSEQLVYTAAAEIPSLQQQIEQEENAISILLGANPAAVPRGRELAAQPYPPEVPAGLASTLLERRPDIREAEQQLIATNADIGVAKAAYFPDVSLTGTIGTESTALSKLFSGPARLWTVGPSLVQPIFTAGRLRSNVRLSEAQQQEALYVYRQTIQTAFRDVSDGLIAYRKSREFRIQQELLTHSAKDSADLADMRYRGGAASYLEVLTNDTNAFSAELALAQARLNELLALVQLYQSLGGGWQQ
jgi:multidrug efflux system outer membrane protein